MERLKSRHTFQDLLSLITRVERPIYTDVINRHSRHGKKKTQRRDLASLFIPVKHSSRNIAYLNNNDIAQKITILKNEFSKIGKFISYKKYKTRYTFFSTNNKFQITFSDRIFLIKILFDTFFLIKN